ncbi:MAG: hypothetical protein E7184_03665 [Erysipelotrichaceae bacterium]|nr:hypothetical protein [Erysipelotrichaceae bacterium]
MDLSRLNSIKLSQASRKKIINDFFPNVDDDLYVDETLNDAHLSLHAGALSLYTTTLVTKVHENSPDSIKLESNQRELDLQECIKNSSKYSHFTEEEIKNKAHEMLLKDIRNSFSHGNFEISYNIHTKKLYFVLQPRRLDFDIDTPIVISKDSLKKANINFVRNIAFKYQSLNPNQLLNEVDNNLDYLLKTLMLPTELLQIADSYLDNKKIQKVTVPEKSYSLIQYSLLVTLMTYEQDDYYNIFGVDSNIFKKIALIRNSIAHDSYIFSNFSKDISYQDRNKILEESLIKSIISLFVVTEQKNAVMSTLNKGHSKESIQNLIDRFKEMFDFFFESNYDLKDFVYIKK